MGRRTVRECVTTGGNFYRFVPTTQDNAIISAGVDAGWADIHKRAGAGLEPKTGTRLFYDC